MSVAFAPQSGVITVFTTNYCPYCVKAKALLSRLGVSFQEVDATEKPELREKLVSWAEGRQTVPQVFIGMRSVGGFSDIDALHHAGQLLPLLDAEGISHL